MKRTFIAVKVPVNQIFLEAYGILKEGLKTEKIKWIESFDMHITLAFIGDTEEKTVMDVKAMLKEDLKGLGKIRFSLKSFGAFKSFRDPKVIFADVEDQGNLKVSHLRIKTGLEKLGVRLEERDFRPHLTVGRVKSLKDTGNLKMLAEKFANVRFQDITVSEIIFYESILRQEGPVYKPLEIIRI